jgi:hypothetical protein
MSALPREIDYVVENILSSLVSSVRREIKKGAKAPSAANLRKILEADLAARGWSIQPIGNAKAAKDAARKLSLALFEDVGQ